MSVLVKQLQTVKNVESWSKDMVNESKDLQTIHLSKDLHQTLCGEESCSFSAHETKGRGCRNTQYILLTFNIILC